MTKKATKFKKLKKVFIVYRKFCMDCCPFWEAFETLKEAEQNIKDCKEEASLGYIHCQNCKQFGPVEYILSAEK